MEDLYTLLDSYKKSGDRKYLNALMEKYNPFIINIASETKDSYVSIENDEEYAIALEAFAEAADRYDDERGEFLTYAALVIKSRIKSYWESEKRHKHGNIEEIDENDLEQKSFEEESLLKDEIMIFERELAKFDLDFTKLADTSPKHKDTRERAVKIALEANKDEELKEHLFRKRRLPISKMVVRFFVSPKVITGSREFIMSIMIADSLNLEGIMNWIKNSQNGT